MPSYDKIQPMHDGWAGNFSFAYFQKLLTTAKAHFDLHFLSEIPSLVKRELKRPTLVLRHDVDVSPKRALIMAELERKMAVAATYMVMVNSPLYSLKDKAVRSWLKKILALNHQIGVHFNISESERNGQLNLQKIEKRIIRVCEQVEDIIRHPVLTVSFHRPIKSLIGGPLRVGGRINAYAKELMEWYISDGRGYWREGEPLPKLLKPEKTFLQLLIHPIWWGEKHQPPADRLQKFFEEETKGKKTREADRFSTALAKTIIMVKRKGLIASK